MADDMRATVRRLVRLTRRGDADLVLGSLSLLGFAGTRRLRQILDTLIEATASMLRSSAPSVPADGLLAVDLRRDDESEVDIDEIDPPVRATIRALLARVNDSPQDADDQIALAVAGGAEATVDVVALALGWTVNAVESCERTGLPMPDWLRGAA